MEKINKEDLHLLFQQIKAKDKPSLEKLYKNYKDLIYSISFSIVKDNYISEEVVQTVFLKILQLPPNSLPSHSEASWLYTTTKNQTIDLLRKKFNYIDLDTLYNVKDCNDEINNIVNKNTYNKIIDNLSKIEKEIVSLKLLSNFTFKEIGELLAIPTATVQWKYYKSLHSLKFLLGNLMMFILTFALYLKTKSTKTNISRSESIKNDNKTFSGNQNLSVQNIVCDASISAHTVSDISSNNIQIGLFSFSTIFLILTIIFTIIFTKRQQKKHKKRLNIMSK